MYSCVLQGRLYVMVIVVGLMFAVDVRAMHDTDEYLAIKEQELEKNRQVKALITDQTLAEAVRAGDVSELEFAINAGGDPNQASPFGRTLLMEAARANRELIVEWLLLAKAEVDAQNHIGVTALQCAAQSANFSFSTRVARALLAGKASVDTYHEDSMSTPLMDARTPSMAKLLLFAGANLRATVNNKRSPLCGKTILDTADKEYLLFLLAAEKAREIIKDQGRTPQELCRDELFLQSIEDPLVRELIIEQGLSSKWREASNEITADGLLINAQIRASCTPMVVEAEKQEQVSVGLEVVYIGLYIGVANALARLLARL